MDRQPSIGSDRSGADVGRVGPAHSAPALPYTSIAAPKADPPTAAEQAVALESLFSGRRLDSIGPKTKPASAKGLQGPPRRRLPRLAAPPVAATVNDLSHAEGEEMRQFSVEVAKILLVTHTPAKPPRAWALPVLRSGTAVAATLFAVAFLGSALAVPSLVAPAADLVPPSGQIAYGFGAPKEDKPGAELVAVCHVEGNGSSHLIHVADSAVEAHLLHGDSLGECAEVPDDDEEGAGDDEDDEGSDEGDGQGAADVAVCRVEGNGSSHTVWVSQSAADNLQGDDYLGECIPDEPDGNETIPNDGNETLPDDGNETVPDGNESLPDDEDTEEDPGEESPPETVAVCRVEGNGSSHTVYVSESASEHLQGDDYLGECIPDEPDGNETLPDDGNETLPDDGNETIPDDGNETIPDDGNETVPDGNETDTDDNETPPPRRGGGGGGGGGPGPGAEGDTSAPPSSPPGQSGPSSGASESAPDPPAAKPQEDEFVEEGQDVPGLPGFTTLGMEVSLEATSGGRSRRHHTPLSDDGDADSADE